MLVQVLPFFFTMGNGAHMEYTMDVDTLIYLAREAYRLYQLDRDNEALLTQCQKYLERALHAVEKE